MKIHLNLRNVLSRKYHRIPVWLLLSMILVGAVGVRAAQFVTVSFTGTNATGLTAQTTLNFGTVTNATVGSKLFPSALTTGASYTHTNQIAFLAPANWQQEFSGVSILLQTQGATPNPVACVQLGSGTCPTSVSSSFTATGTLSTYDYKVDYTTQPMLPSSFPLLQITWTQTS